jgi:site-specific recombinase XerD
MNAKQSPAPLLDTVEHVATLRKHARHNPPEVAINGAQEDYYYAIEFIYSYRGSEATFNAYRREIERLLHWSWHIAHKCVKDLRRHDIEDYIEFCQNPPTAWIGVKNVARFIAQGDTRLVNPQWRPFVATVSKIAHRQGEAPNPKSYSLSQKAVQAIFAVLSSFYNYLIQEDYTALNPVAQMRQKSKFIRKQQAQPIIRRLSELQWAYVIETAELLASLQPELHERTLFIMNALYGMYLRISELASSARWQPQMGHFYKDSDNNWWFTTVGKGNKQRLITVSNAMLQALKRYRLSLGLPPLPTTGEATPLIVNAKTRKAITSTRQIRTIVQTCFNEAVERMIQDGFAEDAEQLKAATVHWLRHTGISEDVKHRPREHVRDDAGHGSSAITDKYIDIELRERHASGRRKTIKPQ